MWLVPPPLHMPPYGQRLPHQPVLATTFAQHLGATHDLCTNCKAVVKLGCAIDSPEKLIEMPLLPLPQCLIRENGGVA